MRVVALIAIFIVMILLFIVLPTVFFARAAS